MVRLLTKFQKNRTKTFGDIHALATSSAVLRARVLTNLQMKKSEDWIKLLFKMAISFFRSFEFLDQNFQKYIFLSDKKSKNFDFIENGTYVTDLCTIYLHVKFQLFI